MRETMVEQIIAIAWINDVNRISQRWRPMTGLGSRVIVLRKKNQGLNPLYFLSLSLSLGTGKG